MLEVKLVLDFACCTCEEPVSVTVKCAGKGLALTGRTVASVNIPCPTCGAISTLYFEPNGTIRSVVPYCGTRRTSEPSLN